MLNALREVVRSDLGGSVVFVVQDLRSNGDWAFAIVEPTWANNQRIPPETTPLYTERRAEGRPLDGLRTEVIWRRESGRWRVVAHEIGATDVWWIAYCDQTPPGVLAGCEGR